MTIAGWIFMLTSWTVIIGLLIFCLKKTFLDGSNQKNEPEQPEQSPLGK